MRERAVVLSILNHPALLEIVEEEFASFHIKNNDLTALRQAVLGAWLEQIPLDFQSLKRHLESSGLAELLSRNQISPADPPYVRPEASDEDALVGFREAVRLHHDQAVLKGEREQDVAALGNDFSDAEWDRLRASVKDQLAAEERAIEDEAQRE
jgi:DNA primase